MFSTHFLFLVLACLLGFIHLARLDDECEPGAVINLTISKNDTLNWEAPPEEQCEIAYYFVQVHDTDGNEQLSYTVADPLIHIEVLESCKTYSFRVSQVTTENITGPARETRYRTPPASDANLHLDYVRLNQNGRNIRLAWSLEEQYISCANSYRVVVVNEEDEIVYDIYTPEPNARLEFIVPCSHYTISVRALFTLEEEGPATVVHHRANDYPAIAPILTSVQHASTSITFEWFLEDYFFNRCHMTALLIDASPYFNVTYPIRDGQDREPLHLRLTGLDPDTLYYLRVRVNNTGGPSPAALVAVQTLPSS